MTGYDGLLILGVLVVSLAVAWLLAGWITRHTHKP